MSTPTSTFLNSPSFAKAGRMDIGGAGPARANKMGLESGAQFADLMKNYGAAQLKPAEPESKTQALVGESAAKPLNPTAPKAPAEGKTELQRQEERLALKKPAQASEAKPRNSSPNQGPKGAPATAVSPEPQKPSAAQADDASNATSGDSAEEAVDQPADARLISGEAWGTALPQQAAIGPAAQAVDSTAAEQALTESLSPGQGLAAQIAANSSATSSLHPVDEAERKYDATKSSANLAPLAQGRAASAARHSESLADLNQRQAGTVNAFDSSSQAGRNLGSEVRALLNGTASSNGESRANKIDGASFEGMLAAAGIAASPAVEIKSSSAAPTQVAISQQITEPSFAPEMAARLSVLAADGVQEARLHLNPAEMGPVSVQIVVEGQQAAVSFHAEHESTRSILEQSLPDLAAALRESGLTLSGGGVFQQPREQDKSGQSGPGEGSRKNADRGANSGISATGEATPSPVRQSRGVVDLYA